MLVALLIHERLPDMNKQVVLAHDPLRNQRGKNIIMPAKSGAQNMAGASSRRNAVFWVLNGVQVSFGSVTMPARAISLTP